MAAFYDLDFVKSISHEMLVLDNNILFSLITDKQYFDEFMDVFKENPLLIDPIVKLEFMRGAFKLSTYEQQIKFLEFKRFSNMIESYQVDKKVYENVFNIARIYSHHENTSIPLGDIFIIARLHAYTYNLLFLTKDHSDFDTVLFDRLGVVSIERKLKKKINHDRLEHIQVLRFNHAKYQSCLKSLPTS